MQEGRDYRRTPTEGRPLSPTEGAHEGPAGKIRRPARGLAGPRGVLAQATHGLPGVAAFGGNLQGHPTNSVVRTMDPVQRILVVSNMYPTPEHPAGGIFVHEQVKALRRRGVDVRVVTGRAVWISRNPARAAKRLAQCMRTPWPGWDLHDDVPVARFPYPAGSFARPWTHPWLYAAALRRWLPAITDTFPYEVVHAHTAFLDGRAGILAARRRRVPLILTEHTGPLSTVTADRRMRMHAQAGVESAMRLIAVSHALRRDMLAQLRIPDESRLVVLPNGVDTAFFDPAQETGGDGAPVASQANREDAQGPWSDPDTVHALWVGHHVEVKRGDRLLEAFAIACRHQRRLRLTMLGSGPLEPALRERAATLGIAERIRFLPAADRAGVRKEMAQADFLVLPSDSETFGVVVIEALSMGLPVLATACGGPEDVLCDGSLGLLAGNNLEDIALGLQRIARCLPAYRRDEIRRAAIERFDYARLAEELAALYAQVTAPTERFSPEGVPVRVDSPMRPGAGRGRPPLGRSSD